MIDAAAVYPSQDQLPHYLHTFGVISTLGLIMLALFKFLFCGSTYFSIIKDINILNSI